jgi:two-component system sensor histidine kinase PilS (NtrC family)
MSGLLTVDRGGRVTSFNAEAERITGLSRAEACGKAVEEILPGIESVIDPTRIDPAGTRARIPYLDRDGTRLHLGIGAYILRDETANEEGRVVIFQNVSQVVQMEEDLRRSERLAAIGTLAASIAHEIRNPLAAISGSIQMLRARTGPDADEPARLMDIVIREVDRLNHLISDFLGYAHPAPLATEAVELAPLVDEVMELVCPAAGARVSVAADVEPGLHVLADPERLRQVLWNLLLNGIEAMPDGGRLRIEARSRRGSAPQDGDSPGRMDPEGKGTRVELAVMDQGIGVDAKIAERIFDPFFTTKAGGSGLGLPTVHRIIEEHGGSLRMERKSGEWSTVMRIRLPSPGASA